MSEQPVNVTLYKWAGAWGPFRIRIPCGECSLTMDVLRDTFEHELAGIPIELQVHEWLTEWLRPLRYGGWHAPIVQVEKRIISQGHALNRGLLTQTVIEAHAARSRVDGNHLFGKESCPHCRRAKKYLEEAEIPYIYHDVVRNPRALYEMLARVKPIIGAKTPVTVPQIWINSRYVGGADQLERIVAQHVDPNPDRGQCSLSPRRYPQE